MSSFDTKICRKLGLQSFHIEQLRDLDAFDELSDIDYLAKLEKRNSSLIRELSNKGLIPDNPLEELNNDRRRAFRLIEIFGSGSVCELVEGFKWDFRILKKTEGIDETKILKAKENLQKLAVGS